MITRAPPLAISESIVVPMIWVMKLERFGSASSGT